MTDRFNGTWTIDLSHSFVWDDALKKLVPDEVGEEVVTLHTEDRLQTYEVVYGDRPKIRMGYVAQFDSPTWTPYAVKEIIASSNDVAAEVADFKRRIKSDAGERDRSFEIGKPYSFVRVVYVDEYTHYRVNMSATGSKAQSILLRRLSDDATSYLSTVLDVNGIVHRIRRFVRA